MAKILLVDDEAPILRSTRLLLQHMGHQVVSTHEAAMVLPLLRRERPDLLLQDLRMPGLDIDALVRSMRADPVCSQVPILLFSASIDLEDVRERTRAAGALEKPFRPDELREGVTRALQHARSLAGSIRAV